MQFTVDSELFTLLTYKFYKSLLRTMSSRILKTAVVVVFTVAVIRKLGVGAESELSLLRQENARLTRVLSDLQQNYSSFITEQQATSADVDYKVENGEGQTVVNECLQSAMHLLGESVHVYDNFVKEEISKAKNELCKPVCTEGERDWTYEYEAAKCDVAEHVEKEILSPFAKRADKLRDSADGLLSALVKSLRNQFGASIDSGQSSS